MKKCKDFIDPIVSVGNLYNYTMLHKLCCV